MHQPSPIFVTKGYVNLQVLILLVLRTQTLNVSYIHRLNTKALYNCYFYLGIYDTHVLK